jgi:pimeloyl-ACP methyl ester carboxylesterase
VLGGAPAFVFGSSGGAVVGLALVTAHPGQMRTLIASPSPFTGAIRAMVYAVSGLAMANVTRSKTPIQHRAATLADHRRWHKDNLSLKRPIARDACWP